MRPAPRAPVPRRLADAPPGVCCSDGSSCGPQLYDQRMEQEQAKRCAPLTPALVPACAQSRPAARSIAALEQQLSRGQLRRTQLVSAEQMARSQATQLRTTLEMLLGDDDAALQGSEGAEDASEHDELTERLGRQVAEVESQAARHQADLSKLQTEIDVLQAELRQRKSAQLRASRDVEQALAGLVEEHS